MVFYQARRSERRTMDEKTTILDLSNEMLLSVLESVAVPDLLKLRQTCKRVARVSNTSLQERVKTLCIHSSVKSLRTAIEICKHPVFSVGVEEVVILGKTDRRALDKRFPGYIESTEQTLEVRSEWVLHDRFNPWPCRYPQETSEVHATTASAAPAHETAMARSSATPLGPLGVPRLTFREAYKPLVAALETLPKLSALTYAEAVRGAGFNQVSQAAMNAHAHKYSTPVPTHHMQESDCCASSGLFDGLRQLSDAEVVFGLMFDSGLHFTTVRFQAEPLVVDSLMRHQDLICRGIRPIPDVLTRLHVSLSFSELVPFNARHMLFGNAFLIGQETLQHLSIVLEPDVGKRVRSGNTLSGFLPAQLWSSLKSFEFIQGSSERLRRRNSSAKALRTVRPTVQGFDILAFLDSHSKTLTSVRISNVLFDSRPFNINYAGSFYHAPVRSIKVALERMRQAVELTDFVWEVNRFTHDPRCPNDDDQPVQDCAMYDCGLYSTSTTFGDVLLRDLEELAAQVGVHLDVSSQSWDFGEAFMRPRRAEQSDEQKQDSEAVEEKTDGSSEEIR